VYLFFPPPFLRIMHTHVVVSVKNVCVYFFRRSVNCISCEAAWRVFLAKMCVYFLRYLFVCAFLDNSIKRNKYAHKDEHLCVHIDAHICVFISFFFPLANSAATHLQHTAREEATHCNALQRAATHCNCMYEREEARGYGANSAYT